MGLREKGGWMENKKHIPAIPIASRLSRPRGALRRDGVEEEREEGDEGGERETHLDDDEQQTTTPVVESKQRGKECMFSLFFLSLCLCVCVCVCLGLI
jgi:hypothetical protein